MQRNTLAVFAVIAVLLTGCGSQTAPASATSSTPSPSATYTEDPEIAAMVKAAADTIATRKAEEKAAAARAVRYDFNCSTGSSAIGDKSSAHVHTFQAVWADPKFASLKSCDGRVGASWWHDKYTLEANEKAVVDQIAADGGDVSSPSGAYSDVLAACLITPADNWDASKGVKVRVQAIAKAALSMCPDAPFAAELNRVAAGEPGNRMDDGNYAVGKDIAAGTYQIQVPAGANGVHDCYWERAGAQGGTIANNFITYAPQGPVVTIYAGEGFTSQRCGTWAKIG